VSSRLRQALAGGLGPGGPLAAVIPAADRLSRGCRCTSCGTRVPRPAAPPPEGSGGDSEVPGRPGASGAVALAVRVLDVRRHRVVHRATRGALWATRRRLTSRSRSATPGRTQHGPAGISRSFGCAQIWAIWVRTAEEAGWPQPNRSYSSICRWSRSMCRSAALYSPYRPWPWPRFSPPGARARSVHRCAGPAQRR
jgi:hypothetical protein